MTARLGHIVLALVMLALILVVGTWVRNETLTRHQKVSLTSVLEVEFSVRVHTEAEAEEAELAESLISLCQLEVRATAAPDSIQNKGDHRFRVAFRPALDSADRRQLKGCIQDLRIDNFLAHVESMEVHDPRAAPTRAVE